LGQSDRTTGPRPLTAFAADLRAVLMGSGTRPPYVLVGGSFGRMLAAHYASLYPAEVAGVLLVDATYPAHNQRALAVLPPETADEPAARQAFRRQLWQTDQLPPETDDWEGLNVPASIEAARGWRLGAAPLIVLTAGLDEWEDGFPLDAAQRYAQMWLGLQQELAALSSKGQQRTVADSDHQIHERRPDVVMAAIRELAGGREY